MKMKTFKQNLVEYFYWFISVKYNTRIWQSFSNVGKLNKSRENHIKFLKPNFVEMYWMYYLVIYEAIFKQRKTFIFHKCQIEIHQTIKPWKIMCFSIRIVVLFCCICKMPTRQTQTYKWSPCVFTNTFSHQFSSSHSSILISAVVYVTSINPR